MNPNDYEGSLEQAERACFVELMNALELQEGTTASIGIGKGRPGGMVWQIGELATGATMTFPACAHHFKGSLDLYNRERETLQRWIMRLISRYPANHKYNRDSPLRVDDNIIHFRIAPDRGAVGPVKPTVVEASNTGRVPTWTAHLTFDVVFIADPDYVDGSVSAGNGNENDGGSTDANGNESGGGGSSGGGEIPDDD